mmetsp:Transcript_20175/g.56271  ORF Transcript_20175/g.56271 Transcript_20175/m.56271 type:complete len:325 (-) Transcript_20175:1577-2551(-)
MGLVQYAGWGRRRRRCGHGLPHIGVAGGDPRPSLRRYRRGARQQRHSVSALAEWLAGFGRAPDRCQRRHGDNGCCEALAAAAVLGQHSRRLHRLRRRFARRLCEGAAEFPAGRRPACRGHSQWLCHGRLGSRAEQETKNGGLGPAAERTSPAAAFRAPLCRSHGQAGLLVELGRASLRRRRRPHLSRVRTGRAGRRLRRCECTEEDDHGRKVWRRVELQAGSRHGVNFQGLAGEGPRDGDGERSQRVWKDARTPQHRAAQQALARLLPAPRARGAHCAAVPHRGQRSGLDRSGGLQADGRGAVAGGPHALAGGGAAPHPNRRRS